MSTRTSIPAPPSTQDLPVQERHQLNGNGHYDSNDLHDDWLRDPLVAQSRPRGPYTVENAERYLDEEPVELYNGWLVWQEMTDLVERRAVSNMQAMLDLSARNIGFGQGLSDQHECMIDNINVIKPDASLISWKRFEEKVIPVGPNGRPTLLGAPELVIESRSPSNRRVQEERKRAQYFANGTQIIWDVDAENQVIYVYRIESPKDPKRFDMGDEIDCEPLLPNWRRRVADMFADEASAKTVAGEVADVWKDEGIEIGREEGIEIGREEGIEIGREEGIEQGTIEMARAMHAKGLPIETIADVAGVTAKNVQAWLDVAD